MSAATIPSALAEICVDDLEGALSADRVGAHRIELCANLGEGGTTPSMGLIMSVFRAVTHAGVQVIVRPRGGDFVYSHEEIDVMCADISAIADAATHAATPVGVVLGALTPSGDVDVTAMSRLLAAAAPLSVTFHKAFDVTADLFAAFDVLRDLGVSRVLTSGGPGAAADNLHTLAELVRLSEMERSPIVLVGGSVRPANVRSILAATGAHEVHARLQDPSPRGDGTLRTNPDSIAELLAELGGSVPTLDGSAQPTPTPPASSVVLALDIGGTNLKAAVVNAAGRSIDIRSVSAGATGDESLERIVELLTGLRVSAEAAGHTVVGAGVVTPGMVDAQNGIVRYASSLDWTNVPLRSLLATALGVPVQIGHDVRSSGFAESLFGASAGVDNSVLVAIGTGVAASIRSGGHSVVGAITTAGELGHIPVIPDGELCSCGQRGCLEVYLSGAGLARRYAALGGQEGLDAAAIVPRLGSDPIADRVWADGVHAFALGLTSLTLLIDPTMIVLGGGVSRAGDRLLAPLRVALSESLAWRDAPEIRVSELGTSGGRIGAAVLAFRAAGLGQVPESWLVADVLA
ncbi:copper homeostasis protein CutC [Mycetocola zhadangensis]|uniref:copper homeostasis protein CutC n=1 Tax=Mycetocola zhadangensis TaxID=1164595 RepID=UPI003A4D57F5